MGRLPFLVFLAVDFGKGSGLHNPDVVKQFDAQVLHGHEGEQGVVVKSGGATHAGTPLGLHLGKQAENLVVLRPHFNKVILVVSQREAGACDGFFGNLWRVQGSSGLG
jgi:hypothetical protein